MTKFGRLCIGLAILGCPAMAEDIIGVQAAAADQPRIYGVLKTSPDGQPISATVDFFGEIITTIAIDGFLDTGASGVVLAETTADSMDLTREGSGTGSAHIFRDVGVGGSTNFNITQPLYVGLANFHPSIDPENAANYTQTFGPIRSQIGPLGLSEESALAGVNIFGTPVMAGKVVVMDPKPVDGFSDPVSEIGFMKTYIYDQGTPDRTATTPASDPGIPATSRTVLLSKADMGRFTEVEPSTAQPPAIGRNPFIGPDPTANLPVDLTNPQPAGQTDIPGITISKGGHASTGSWLFDTGSQFSVISEAQAQALGIQYDHSGADPVLVYTETGLPVESQFSLPFAGIGGETSASGLFLDWLLVPTAEGNASDVNDPNHLRYLGAPVLVADITVQDPDQPDVFLTLDGVFGMNNLVASFPGDTLDITPGAFNWIVYNDALGTLGLEIKQEVPEPQTLGLLVLTAILARRR